MSHEEIGLALGIHRHTLSKHFEHELTVGAYRKRLEAIEGLHRAAKKGGAAAAKAYLSLTPKVAAPPAPKLEKIGKKAQAAADAQTAHVGSDWETLLQPTTTVQ
ncbi:hypothetical protein [Hydrocarboniphaga effusa]|uniref:hypothetical protein n=1 Tax=Hydrocarboniphaga effusa TaxID=243629 RepID=UPI003BAD20E5